MLHLHVADRAEPLAGRLAEVLAAPPADPLEPEWIAVPSVGMRRWLALELARHLGATPGRADGVAANLGRAFGGTLRSLVLAAARRPEEVDPWTVERLAWPVLEHLHGVPPLPGDPPLLGRARRVADLFDRYHVHRPEMVLDWHRGRDVDHDGNLLPEHHRWQPELWRAVRDRLGVPSPPEALPPALDALRAGSLALDLPSRLVLFGFPVLPGGRSFLPLAEAVAAHRDVHLFLLNPSPGSAPDGTSSVEGAAVAHPLLRSWGRLPREAAELLGRAGHPVRPATLAPAPLAAAGTLLGELQADLRAGVAPASTFTLSPQDRSVQFHATHGPARQVEVARDAILHLLAEDPTLREEDVLVASPALERFGSLVEGAFGPPASGPADGATSPVPALRYRVTDRSIRGANTVVTGMAALLDLVVGRFDAPATLDALALPALRRRYRFDDDDLARVSRWVATANIRWGLDAEGRVPFGVPAGLTTNTWQAGLDRLLVGIAVSDDEPAAATGGVVPLGLEGDDALLAGRVADAIGRLAAVARATHHPRPIAEWVDLLAELARDVLAPPPDEAWHAEALTRILGDLREESGPPGTPSPAPLTFADLRRLLEPRLVAAPGRPDYFRGGITVTSLDSLRWIPHRVICLLGMDQPAFGAGAADGDDLVAAAPLRGDRDPRGEARQAVLEAVLAAGTHLVVVRDGHDLRTNQEIPPAVVVAELQDLVRATAAPHTFSSGPGGRPLEVAHPRQAFDERAFLPQGPAGTPWSFDERARAGAEARRRRRASATPFLTEPLGAPPPPTVVDLAELQVAVSHPIKAFVDDRLHLRLPRSEEAPATRLPVDVKALEEWKIGDRLLEALQDGQDLAELLDVEAAIGCLPPGTLGVAKAAEVREKVEALLAAAAALGVEVGAPTTHPIDARLPDGTRVVGSVSGRLASPEPGPARIGYGRMKAKYHLSAWLELLALTATDPDVAWRSVVVNIRKPKGTDVRDLVVAGSTPAERRAHAEHGLEVAVDLLRRSRCEPLPLFPTVSEALVRGRASRNDWVGAVFGGDRLDRYVEVAYGDLELRDVLALEPRPGDPDGPGRRAERYARHLWDVVAETSSDRAAPP